MPGKTKMDLGVPKVCGIINGKDSESVLWQLEAAENLELDMVEWRLDALVQSRQDIYDKRVLLQSSAKGIGALGLPVILTLRSDREGGFFEGSLENYFEVLQETEKFCVFEYIDIEYARWILWSEREEGPLPLRSGSRIVSHHDFKSMPAATEIGGLFDDMAQLDAVWVKGAFMAHDFSDTLRLMEAALAFKKRRPDKKLIYMAMGEAGVMSRILQGEAASGVTYATLDESGPAAPGQWKIKPLIDMMKLLKSREA